MRPPSFFAREDPKAWFSQADREALRQAAQEAERGHAGEIVPYVVRHCAPDGSWVWPGVAIGALAGASLTGLGLQFLAWAPGGAPELWVLLPPFVGAAAAWLLLMLFPGLEARLLPDGVLAARVQGRARLAFLDEGVYQTRDRSGILIFVALRERHVVVLADKGIHAAVPQEAWQGIVSDLTGALRQGRPSEGLAEAIAACGRLLRACGPQPRGQDLNELSDDLRPAPSTESHDGP